MATGTIAPYPRHQFFDANGDPLSSGTLETYVAGTSTALATYSDVGLLVANPTTITLNSAGVPSVSGTEVALFLTPGLSYKWIVKNSAGSTIFTRDNIGAVPSATVDLDVTGTAGETIAAGEAVYLSDGSGARTAGRWYLSDADVPYTSSAAILVAIAPSSIASGSSGSIRLNGRVTGLAGLTTGATYYVSATAGALTATAPANARFIGVADSTSTLILAANPPPVVDPSINEGRLTLTTGVPVTTADVTSAGTIYFTPHRGNRIALYDGTRWTRWTFTELSLALTATSGLPYDVFVYDNAGTLTLEITAWASTSARATSIQRQDGVWVRNGAVTRRLLGSFVASGTNITEDSLQKRLLQQADAVNRVSRPLTLLETTDSWSLGVTTAFRIARAVSTNQIEIAVCLAEEAIAVDLDVLARNSGTNEVMNNAIGEDSSTTAATGSTISSINSISDLRFNMHAHLRKVPAVGYRTYRWLEGTTISGGGSTTWFGTNGTPTTAQSGLVGLWRA